MILAIDPGPNESGWVIYDPAQSTLPVIGMGISANEAILGTIRTAPVLLVVIEDMVSHGMPVGTPFIHATRWSGDFRRQANIVGLPVRFISNPAVRSYICHDGRASMKNIRAGLIEKFGGGDRKVAVGTKKQPGPLFGIPDKRGDHKWSALALAVTAAEETNNS